MGSQRTPAKLRRTADRLDREVADLRVAGRALAARRGAGPEAKGLRRRAPFASQIADLERRAYKLRADADRIEGRLTVSDHALVRYVERAYGLDLDAVRAEIAPPELHAVAARLGDGEFPVEGGAGTHYAVVTDGCVVTVLTS